jgi:hypothetical protein
MIGACNINVEEKSNEIAIVEMAYTVIHPGTMMICDLDE